MGLHEVAQGLGILLVRQAPEGLAASHKRSEGNDNMEPLGFTTKPDGKLRRHLQTHVYATLAALPDPSPPREPLLAQHLGRGLGSRYYGQCGQCVSPLVAADRSRAHRKFHALQGRLGFPNIPNPTHRPPKPQTLNRQQSVCAAVQCLNNAFEQGLTSRRDIYGTQLTQQRE